MIMSAESSSLDAIRPFHINVPEAKLTELRRRISATNWPDRETVTDQSQGVQLATIQKLAQYWSTEYDWRKCEAKTSSTKAATLRPGNSRSSLQKKFARVSDHCANRPEDFGARVVRADSLARAADIICAVPMSAFGSKADIAI
jgi:hypothetical protein